MAVCLTDPGGRTLISKLNHDLLFEIFYINAAGDPPKEYDSDATAMNPLVMTRKTSHVCQEWYTIILQSPSIWARCFNLDALFQRNSDTWRRLVLARTGESLLSVTGTNYMPHSCGVERFLLQLLQEHWSRIRDFDVTLASFARDWKIIMPYIIALFARPAENLRTFVLRAGAEGIPDTGPTPHRSYLFDSTFRLFSNHAPSLVHISIETKLVPVQFTENFVLSVNMRHLQLGHHALVIKEIDLLSVFMQMPQLEHVDIAVYKLDINPSSLRPKLLRPSLPRLKWFRLVSMDLGVYAALLDRIDPGWECKFYFMHHIREWTGTDLEEETWTEIGHSMRRVAEHYAHHLFAQSQSHSPDVVDVDIELCGDYKIQFACYKRRMVIDLEVYDDTARNIMMQRLFDTLAAVDLPNPVNQLQLYISRIFLTEFPFVIQGLKLPRSVTNFIGTSAEISYIHAISGSASENPVFPLLNTLSICPSEHLNDGKVYEAAIAFVRNRQRAAVPIDSVVFLQWDRRHRFKENPKPDVHAFDQLTGLKVVWYQSGTRYEHVCGTGIEKQPSAVTNVESDITY